MRAGGYILGILGSGYGSILVAFEGPYTLIVVCIIAVMLGGILVGND